MNIWLCTYLDGQQHKISNQKRLINSFLDNGFKGNILTVDSKSRPSWPNHISLNYAFKSHCLKEALDNGADIAIWCDCNMVLCKPIDILTDKITQNPVFLPKNAGWTVGQWTHDRCLNEFNISRETAYNIPTVVSGFIAFDFRNKQSLVFFDKFYNLCRIPEIINGDRGSKSPAAGKKDVFGHRHDQSVLSLMAYTMKIPLIENVYADPSNAVGIPNNPLIETGETIVKWQPN